jgi:hypothetical protein
MLLRQTTQGRTLLKNVELVVQKMGCGSLRIHQTDPISHSRISSFLDPF